MVIFGLDILIVGAGVAAVSPDLEVVASTDAFTPQVVQRHEFAGSHAIFFGNRLQGLASSHLVIGGSCLANVAFPTDVLIDSGGVSSRLDHVAMGIQVIAVVVDAVLAHDEAVDLLRRQHEHVRVIVAGNHVGTVLRIEGADLLDGDVEHFGNLCEVDAAVHAHGVGDERLAGQ